MAKYTFKLEVVTPLFLSGADQSTAELRAPSIKGAMRFWFRAMAGGIIGTDDLNLIRQKEAAILGSTDSASTFSLNVHGETNNQRTWQELEQTPTSAVRQMGQGRSSSFPKQGLSYLGFSLKQNRNRKCLIPDNKLNIHLSTRTLGGDILVPLSCLWLLLFLGGLGSRSRRGFGGLRVLEAPNNLSNALPAFQTTVNNGTATVQFLSESLQQIQSLFKEKMNLNNYTGQSTPQFPVIDSQHFRLVVLDKQWCSWHDALNEIGWELLNFRKDKHPTLAELSRNTKTSLQRAAFGLPVQFYDRGTRQSISLSANDLERRASPIFIRPLRLNNGKFLILLELFKCEFLPSGKEELVAVSKQLGKVTVGKVTDNDFGIIEKFLNEMKNKYKGIEVTL